MQAQEKARLNAARIVMANFADLEQIAKDHVTLIKDNLEQQFYHLHLEALEFALQAEQKNKKPEDKHINRKIIMIL